MATVARRGIRYLIEELELRKHREQDLRSRILIVSQDTVTHLACLPKQSLHTQPWPAVAALASPFPLTSHNTLCSPLISRVQGTHLAEKFTERKKEGYVSKGFAVPFDHAIEEKDANCTLAPLFRFNYSQRIHSGFCQL